jgi:hypothetical protein
MADRLGSMPPAFTNTGIVPVARTSAPALPLEFSAPFKPGAADMVKLNMTARLPTPQPREAVTPGPRATAAREALNTGKATMNAMAATGQAMRQAKQSATTVRRVALQDRLRQMMGQRGQGAPAAGGLLGYRG